MLLQQNILWKKINSMGFFFNTGESRFFPNMTCSCECSLYAWCCNVMQEDPMSHIKSKLLFLWTDGPLRVAFYLTFHIWLLSSYTFYMIKGCQQFTCLLGGGPHSHIQKRLGNKFHPCSGRLSKFLNQAFFCAHCFCPKWKMVTFSLAHSHALTNATRRYEYFRGLSRLLPVPGVLVSFLELRFPRKWMR